MTEDTTDRIDLLMQAHNVFRWCLDCGMTEQDCKNAHVRCCPTCRHRTIDTSERQDIRHAEMQARANAYYEAALSHQANPDMYKYFFDKRQELLFQLVDERKKP